jgi:hypothetical protein
MVDRHAAFQDYFLEVLEAERVQEPPAHTEEKQLGFEVMPCEKVLIALKETPPLVLNRSRAYRITTFICNAAVIVLSAHTYYVEPGIHHISICVGKLVD